MFFISTIFKETLTVLLSSNRQRQQVDDQKQLTSTNIYSDS